MGFVLAVTALALVAGGCGSSDEEKTTTVSQAETVVASETVPALKGDDAGDPKGVKVSDAGVYVCSSINLKGEIANVAVRRLPRHLRPRHVLHRGQRPHPRHVPRPGTAARTADTVDGYACSVLYSDDAFATVRCAKGEEQAYRFTLQRDSRPAKPKRAKEVTVACGAFSRYYDISARDLSCREAQGIIDRRTPATAITLAQAGRHRDGRPATAARCSTCRPASQTVRCVDGRRACRVSVAGAGRSPVVPKKPPEEAKFVKVVHKPCGTTSSGPQQPRRRPVRVRSLGRLGRDHRTRASPARSSTRP